MAKSRAEIQKAYRQRQKAKNNDEYLRKERERRKRNYVPSDQLSRRDRIRRNEKNNEVLRRHRLRRKEARLAAEEAVAAAHANQPNPDSMDTSGYDSPGSQPASANRLIVRLPFVNRRNGPRKRISRSLAKKTRELSQLKNKFNNLTRKHKSTLRRFQRLRKKLSNVPQKSPRSKTEVQMREAGLHEEQARKIRRQLLLGNALLEEVKLAKRVNNRKIKKALHNIIAGRIVKKYRCVSLMSAKTGLSRNKLNLIKTKTVDIRKQERIRKVRRYRQTVIQFLERDDNSRNLPGKADKIKTGVKQATQKRVLTDYLSNLHAKFLSENPSVSLSLASFQRIRPNHILTTSFISRGSCLCTKHQNMALILKALKREAAHVTVNPERYLESDAITEADLSKEEVTFEQWRRVSVEEKGRQKMVMKIVKVTKNKEDFMTHFRAQTNEFREHIFKMKTQYEQIRILKANLPPHHVVVHMDFAENYSCKSVEEIQSAYWNQTAVTLHPTVIYIKTPGQETVTHHSYVLVSDELGHNATTVVTFIHQIVADIKKLDPAIQCIHYWTDSPTSQYRNKTIFHLVANHESITGIKAWWNYFEARHGKGPCDGLGGVTKRMADQAMKTGKAIIQDASDFFAWSQSAACTMKNIKFRFISKENCETIGRSLGDLKTRPIKGTMKIHAIVGLGNNCLLVRDASCYCDACLVGNHCSDWRQEFTSSDTETYSKETPVQTTLPEGEPTVSNLSCEAEVYGVDDFVIATYEGTWYVGKILEIDPDDESGYTHQISFMKKMKRMFQWPFRDDVIWCKTTDIRCKIAQPVASGKSKRMYSLSNEDWQKVHMLCKSVTDIAE